MIPVIRIRLCRRTIPIRFRGRESRSDNGIECNYHEFRIARRALYYLFAKPRNQWSRRAQASLKPWVSRFAIFESGRVKFSTNNRGVAE